MLLDWTGELAGDWRVDELFELLELLELLELFELFELPDDLDEDVPDEPEMPDEPDVVDEPELVDEPDEPDDVLLLPEDVPECLTLAWVDPGRTASTAPATATLAKDAVTVVAFSRRLPCSRSATARASCRALA